MTSFFWICVLLGGGVVLLQLAASLLGLHHDAPHDTFGHGQVSEGLQLLSIRALSGGVAFFGIGGLAALRMGVPGLAAFGAGLLAAIIAAVAIAFLLRSMHRLEGDQTFVLKNTVGLSGDVYLSIPARRGGTGKIHMTVQQRVMELDAMTTEDDIATGTRVLVIDAIAPATVIVVPQPLILKDGDSDA
jgi:hypothetical protein